MADQPSLTRPGLEKLQREIEEWRSRRGEVAIRIARAKELGDLSENAEYQEAKEEQAFVEGKILELDDLLHRATIVEQTTNDGIIGFGSRVKVSVDGAAKTFVIVGSNEADPQSGKISSDSPLGAMLLGKKIGDTLVLTVPRGTLKYTITAIH